MTTTFVLAVLGVVLSVASLAWQLMSYVLTGPRVAVGLRLGVADDTGEPQTYWSLATDAPEFFRSDAVTSYSREVALVEVRNRGRSAITLTSFGLAASSSTGRYRRKATVVTGGPARVRLEPGDVHQWHADVWPLVERLRGLRDERVLRVRGAAQIGTTKVVFSSARDTWTVPPEQDSVLPTAARGKADLDDPLRPDL